MHRIWLSEDALNRAGRMNAKLAEWQKQVAGESTNAPLRVDELLASNPFITAKGAADKLGVALTTAPRALNWSGWGAHSLIDSLQAEGLSFGFFVYYSCQRGVKTSHQWANQTQPF